MLRFRYLNGKVLLLLDYCCKRLLHYLAFKFFGFERTWLKLSQKRIVCTKLDVYVFIGSRKISHVKIDILFFSRICHQKFWFCSLNRMNAWKILVWQASCLPLVHVTNYRKIIPLGYVRQQQKLHVFPLILLTLILCAYLPRVFFLPFLNKHCQNVSPVETR